MANPTSSRYFFHCFRTMMTLSCVFWASANCTGQQVRAPAQGASSQSPSRESKLPQHMAPPPAPKPQEQFLVYWTTEPGWSTELLLRNNLESAQLTVTPALRTPDGIETALSAVTIESGEVLSLDLYEALMKAVPRLAGAWGSAVTGN